MVARDPGGSLRRALLVSRERPDLGAGQGRDRWRRCGDVLGSAHRSRIRLRHGWNQSPDAPRLRRTETRQFLGSASREDSEERIALTKASTWNGGSDSTSAEGESYQLDAI